MVYYREGPVVYIDKIDELHEGVGPSLRPPLPNLCQWLLEKG